MRRFIYSVTKIIIVHGTNSKAASKEEIASCSPVDNLGQNDWQYFELRIVGVFLIYSWFSAFLILFIFLNRTNFDYLQEVPVLTLDVNEDFKDKHESLVEKVGLEKN